MPLSEGSPPILIVLTASFFLLAPRITCFSPSPSLSLSLSLQSYVSFSLSFKISSSLLPLSIPRYSQTLLADETRFVLNFLDHAFRTARKFARLTTPGAIVCGLHSYVLTVNSPRYSGEATTVEPHAVLRFFDSANFQMF